MHNNKRHTSKVSGMLRFAAAAFAACLLVVETGTATVGADTLSAVSVSSTSTGSSSSSYSSNSVRSTSTSGTGTTVSTTSAASSSDLTGNSVDVPEILQNPELPTGCESVALTIVLESLGFELETTTIADEYLYYGDNAAYSYVGNPYTSSGAGCFAPGIVRTANKYLRSQNSSLRAKNVSGTEFEDLYDYIDEGIPVILWSTMYMMTPTFTGLTYSYRGETYAWYSQEHCVVLYGYDKESNTVLISDPLEGLVERDADAFAEIYDTVGQYAVVIK